MDGYITSRQNAKIIDACALHERKNREKSGLFCFEGKKLLCEAAQRSVPLTEIFLREDLKEEEALPSSLPGDCRVYRVSAGVYDKLSLEKSPEGVFCIAKTLDKFHNFATIYYKRDFFDKASTLLFAVCLQDPGNLGSIIRSAAAFGCGGLILSRDCADLYSPKTVRASMGTLFDMPITVVDDPSGSIAEIRKDGFFVYAAALDRNADPLPSVDPQKRVCALIGNEGRGLPRELIDLSDGKLFVPMTQGAESLNASVAAAIILYSRYLGSRS